MTIRRSVPDFVDRPVRRLMPVALALLAAGCTGEIGGSVDVPPKGGDGTNATCTPDAELQTTRVRRLTKVEIVNAAGRLLEMDATDLFSNLDADSQTNGAFSNNDQLVVSSSFGISLNVAADVIGQQFKTTVTMADYDPPCFSSDAGGEACAKTFIQTFGKRAFRRAIVDADVAALLPVYMAGRDVGADGDPADRFATGVSWIVRAIFQSPDFLYLTELGDEAVKNGAPTELTAEEVANAISFSILGMPPDDILMQAAEQGALTTPDQRAEQAKRLIAADPDAWKQQMRLFVQQWLGINFAKPDWMKNTDFVPMFSPELKDALETETGLFIDDWATTPSLRQLLTSSSTFVNEVNAPLYGLNASGTDFSKHALDPAQRAGILTLGGFLGSTSHLDATSPVQRGKVIMQKFLCHQPPAPPPNVPPLPPPDMSAPTTTRARYDHHLADPACKDCHSLFQPMGNAFEEYGPIGGFRTEENGFPIDSSGALVGATGGDKVVADAIELTALLAASPDSAECVMRQTFRFAMGHQEGPFDQCSFHDIAVSLDGADVNIEDLMIAVVESKAFVSRTAHY